MVVPEPSPGLDLLRRIQEQLPAHGIDEVWLFPVCTVGGLRSTVALVSVFHDDGHRRRLLTARWAARPGVRPAPAPDYTVFENGIVPPDRIDHLVQGVLNRLAEEFALPPITARIGGDPERWASWLAELPDHV